MKEIEELLKDFVEWLSDKEDVFYAFENTESAIKEYLESKQDTYI